MNATVVSQLGDFCRRLELPLGTAKELITFLTVKTLVGQRKARRLSPSSKLDKLLHAVLLDTELRKSVEVLVGEIHHSEASAGLEDSLKAERRQAMSLYVHNFELRDSQARTSQHSLLQLAHRFQARFVADWHR